VDFHIAKDRRDGLLHATSVNLCEESFIVSKEKRDKGIVYFIARISALNYLADSLSSLFVFKGVMTRSIVDVFSELCS